jgi:lysocardiolipin and lysophospholipid acyltransferase
MSPSSLFRTLKGIFLGITLGIALLIFNLYHLVIMLMVRTWSASRYRRLSTLGVAVWTNYCVWCFERGQGVELVVTGDTLEYPLESALLIPNHQAMVDILMIFAFAKRYRRTGDVKWFAKEAIKYVPIFGWALQCTDSIYMKRNWQKDKEKVEEMFSRFHRDKIPLWLTIFPEGTRRTQRKQEISIIYSGRQGAQPTLKVMYPRTKGFVATVEALRGHINAVYNITIHYPGYPPSLTGIFMGSVKRVYLNIQRFDITSVPEDANITKGWLVDRFLEKERFLNTFDPPKEDS